MKDLSAPELVYVENEWLDGPVAGVANLRGLPHRFQALWEEQADGYSTTYRVWPISAQALQWEQEQWQIFVRWNLRYEAGQATTLTHPGHGGVDARWDELQILLQPDRQAAPSQPLKATAQLVRIDRRQRYALTGPDYQLRWTLLA